MLSSIQKIKPAKLFVAGLLFLGDALSLVHAQGSLPAVKMTDARDDQNVDAVHHKLASIIIPEIALRSTTLAEAVGYMRQMSQNVNIVLRLPAATSAARSIDPSNAGVSGVAAGAETAAAMQSASASASPPAKTRITLTLHNIPLLEALKYIASQAGLKVKIEPYAVVLVPLTENTDEMVTAVFRVPPNFISNVNGVHTGTALDQPATTAR